MGRCASSYSNTPSVQGRALLNAVGNLEMRGPYGDALRELGYTLEVCFLNSL